jgi:4-amino-4-deoxy-L-arabinose transferase-like glycosyltransferase
MSDLKTDETPGTLSPSDAAAAGANGILPGHPNDAAEDAATPADAVGDDNTSARARPLDEISEGEGGSGSEQRSGLERPPETSKIAEDNLLLSRGNPLRWVRGGVTSGLGLLFAFLLMAHSAQLRAGVPLGLLFVLVATWGVMDIAGSFDDDELHVASRTTFDKLAPALGGTVATFGIFAASLGGAATGIGPNIVWGVVITLAFLAFVASIYEVGVRLGPWTLDELGQKRAVWQREGFWVVAAAAGLYFPFMGSFSLWDPWETHYGEVAREVLARDDWISLWWAQDGWFWSKPILNFWIQALAMASLGIHYKADMMMQGAGAIARPEWVVRAPNVLLTIVSMYLLYKGVAKIFGRRAGLLGAVVLATMPDWFFLAHQTMTDMPCVAPLTATMGLLLLGLHVDENARVKNYELKIGRVLLRISGWHLTFGIVLICAIPQVLYLYSRNIELILSGPGQHGFRVHWDEFKNGSPGNCGIPGNEGCVAQLPAAMPKTLGPNGDSIRYVLHRMFGSFEPLLQAALWTIAIGTLLYINWGERRARRLYYLAAWFFAAIATMGKGPMGVALPMVCAFAYIATKKRWSELLRLEIASGLLVILVVALPWYVAMYVRHGAPFTDRLIFHDMFNRAFNHVHDTNEGDDTSFRFYIWQLGYALFPWTALAPLGLSYWMRRSDRADSGKGDVSVFLVMWFIFAFALFSFMGTKFHHYIFPAIPPVAMLIGIVLDEMLGEQPLSTKRNLPLYAAGMTAGVGIAIYGVTHFWPGSYLGVRDKSESVGSGAVTAGVALTAIGIALAVIVARALRGPLEGTAVAAPASTDASIVSPASGGATIPSEAISPERRSHEALMLGGAAIGGALLLALVGRDLIVKPEGADQPGAIRLLQLFTYNYRRAWPDSLDFAAVLTAFVVVACALLALIAVRSLRRHAVAAFVALSIVWAVWGLDVYMVKTAPHWGQREIAEGYYRTRASSDELLVAYQMNWKGENFYTSNHVPAFVSTGGTFTTWLKKKKDEGARVMFFVTEHSRLGGLKSEVGARSYTEVTDKATNNKFVLVRADL